MSKSRDEEGGGDTVTVNLNYLSPSMFLDVSNTRFGPSSAFEALEFRSVSHESGFMESRDDGTAELVFEAKEESPVYLTATVEFYRKDYKELCDRSILRNSQNNRTRFVICFPENGVFIVKIFASSELPGPGVSGCGSKGWLSSWPKNITNYLVVVSNRSGNSFPRVFPRWNSVGCVLIEPLFDELTSHSTVKFVLRVSGARQVVVASSEAGDAATPLDKDFGDFWTGSVTTGAFGTHVNVCARFGENTELVGPFLRYSVVKSHLDHTFDGMVKLEYEILRRENEKLAALRRKTLEKLAAPVTSTTRKQMEEDELRARDWSKRERKRLWKLGQTLKQHQLKERRKAEEKKLNDVAQYERRRLATTLQAMSRELAEVKARNDRVVEDLEQELRRRLVGIADDIEDIVAETGWTDRQLARRREAHQLLMDELHTLHCQTVADVRRKGGQHVADVSRRQGQEVEQLRQVQSKAHAALQQCLDRVFPGVAVEQQPPSRNNSGCQRRQDPSFRDIQSAKGRLLTHPQTTPTRAEQKLGRSNMKDAEENAYDGEEC